MSESAANTSVTLEAFDKLKNLVTALSSQLSALQAEVQLDSLSQFTQQPAPQGSSALFISPLTGNSAAGASPSLFKLFPEVEEATITSIIQHEFRSSDLYKLDPRYLYYNAEWKTLEHSGTAPEHPNDLSLKECKALSSIIVPLSTYFSILITHNQPTGKSALLAVQLFRYIVHLARIASEYEWHAVVSYHMAFFTRRRREMIHGDYGGWGRVDLELLGEYLFPNRKAKASSSTLKKATPADRSTTPCRNFNIGKCIGAVFPRSPAYLFYLW